MKIPSLRNEFFFHAGRQTDMTKLIVAFPILRKSLNKNAAIDLYKKELFIIPLFTAIMLSYGRQHDRSYMYGEKMFVNSCFTERACIF